MEFIRLLKEDGSFDQFEENWAAQCAELDEDFGDYAQAPISMIRKFSSVDSATEWAIAIKHDGRVMATACAILTAQRGYSGKVLRVREVTVCPLLDYGKLDENSYVDTLVGILNGALKLSESTLEAQHIKLHLRSPADAVFFRSFGNTLDSKGVFAATEAHGAWLVISKASALQLVK